MPRLDPAHARQRPSPADQGPVRPRPLLLDAPPGELEPPGAKARLWLADARAQPHTVDALAPRLLDAQEQRRAGSLRRSVDRRCYVTAHVALRLLLGAQLGVPARQIRFRREPCPCCGAPHGRPAPVDPGVPLHFSLSHSGDLALLAFSATEVGADVQRAESAAVADEVRGALHPREEDELTACTDAERPAAFCRAWVRKEAYLKGLGTGLGRSPALDYLGTGATTLSSPSGWRVADVQVPEGYAGAVAVQDAVCGR